MLMPRQETTIDHYRNGWCVILAVLLAEFDPELEVYGLFDEVAYHNPEDGYIPNCMHAVCVDKEGRWIDIGGYVTLDELNEYYGDGWLDTSIFKPYPLDLKHLPGLRLGVKDQKHRRIARAVLKYLKNHG